MRMSPGFGRWATCALRSSAVSAPAVSAPPWKAAGRRRLAIAGWANLLAGAGRACYPSSGVSPH
eukprot:7690169-Lingulodinium_polyedra.AAC.1